MKVQGILIAMVCLLLCLSGCASRGQTEKTSSGESLPAESTTPLDDAGFQQEPAGFAPTDQMTEPFTVSTPIQEVIDDPVFGRYGRLLFPVNDWYMSGDILGDLQLTWYNNIDPNGTVEIINTLWQRDDAGETVFYDIYTDEEKAEDPAKKILDYSFSGEIPEVNLPYAMREVVLLMWELCRTVSHMRWKFLNEDIMLLRSSIAPEPKPPVRIWHGQSVSSLNTQKNWKLIRKDTLSGAVQPEPVWQHGLGLMVRRHLEGMTFHSRVQ